MRTEIEATASADPDSDGAILAHLRTVGLRATSARVSVLRAVRGNPRLALSASQIFRRLQAAGIDASLDTIYRALRVLEDCGSICREWHAADPVAKARYRLAAALRQPDTYTFVCEVCAGRFAVSDQQLSDLLYRHAEAAGFERMLAQIRFRIRCNGCA